MSTLDNLRKAAKRWLKALRDGDADARARLSRAYPDAPEPITLRDVQHALARERGHQSWIALKEALADGASRESPLDALLAAASRGDAEGVAVILDEQNQRMDRTNYRRAPLHLAVVKRRPEAIAALIELGADLNLEDAVGLTPLDQAALIGEHEMVRLLIDGGAAITLPAAIVLERSDDIDRLIRANPEVLSPTNNRRWARLVVHASSHASRRVMETLLRTVMRHRAGLTRILYSLCDEPHNGHGAHGAPARERRGAEGPRERPSGGVGRSPT